MGNVVFLISHLYHQKQHRNAARKINNERKTIDDTEITDKLLLKSCTSSSKYSLYFLKIHKSGSSSVDNIIKRHALAHKWTHPIFVNTDTFPEPDMNADLFPIHKFINTMGSCSSDFRMTCPPEVKFTREEALRERKYNYIDARTVFNDGHVREVLAGRPNYVVAIRHPLSQMQSVMHQFNLWPELSLQENFLTLKTFLKNPKQYDKLIPYHRSKHILLSFTKDFMAYAFGYHSRESPVSFLKRINSTFNVAIIAEKYAESLVLMRWKLCWNIKDIVSIELNSAQSLEYINSFKPLTEVNQDLIDAHRNWSTVDYALYKMFLDRHNAEVARYGPAFQAEVKFVREMNQNVTEFCLRIHKVLLNSANRVEALEEKLVIPRCNFTLSFVVTAADCVFMALHTDKFRHFLLQRQFPYVCDLHASNITHPSAIKNMLKFCPNRLQNAKAEMSLAYDFPLSEVLENGLMVDNPWSHTYSDSGA